MSKVSLTKQNPLRNDSILPFLWGQIKATLVTNHRNGSTLYQRDFSHIMGSSSRRLGLLRCPFCSVLLCRAFSASQQLGSSQKAQWPRAHLVLDTRTCSLRFPQTGFKVVGPLNTLRKNVCFHHCYLADLHARKFRLNLWKTSLITFITRLCATWQPGYVLRKSSLGDFFVVWTSWSVLIHT